MSNHLSNILIVILIIIEVKKRPCFFYRYKGLQKNQSFIPGENNHSNYLIDLHKINKKKEKLINLSFIFQPIEIDGIPISKNEFIQ